MPIEHESVLGMDCVLYRNANTDTDWYENPDWVAINNAKDVKLPLKKGQTDVSTRGSGKWRAKRGTLRDAAVSWNMVFAPADAGFQAVRDAWLTDEPIELLVLSGPIDEVGSEGLRALFEIFDFERDESLENAVMVDVTAEPTYSTHAPTWLEVTE